MDKSRISVILGCEEIDLSDVAGNPSPRPSPRGRGRAVSVTCQCIFFVEWENHVQVTPLNRPLPPGEGWGEGLPATSVRSISSHPLSEGWVGPRGAKDLCADREVAPLNRPLPPGEGWGEGLPATSVRSSSSHPRSEGWVGPRGAKDLCADREVAPRFVRGSFAPIPAPTLSLRMTHGCFGLSITGGGTPQTP